MRIVTTILMVFLVAPMGQANAPVEARQSTAAVRQRLAGTWRLVRYEIFDAAGGPSRPGAYNEGRITYDAAGQMSAQLMNSTDRPSPAPATDADRAAAYRRYLGYYGPFTVDEAKGVVIHHVRGSSNPGWVGSDQLRHYALGADGNTLTLSLKNGDRVTQSLYWERVK